MISGLFFYYDYSRIEPHSVSVHDHPYRNLSSLSFLNTVGKEYHPFSIKRACNGLILCQNYQIITVSECEPLRDGLEGVFWNGAIHWLSHENAHLRFDVDEEKLIKTHNPPSPKIFSMDKTRYFGECGGHLLLIQMCL
ncbi:hypothetical protein ACSBR2_025306 [Camellia fascicularis]